MSALTSERMMELMAFADGELEGTELARVAASLATDEEAARFVKELGTLGDFVRLGDSASPARAVDLTDAIMASVKAEAPAAAPAKPKVVSLADARVKKSSSLRTGGAVLAALALAAAVFVYARPKEAPMGGGGTMAKNEPAAAVTEPVNASTSIGVEVKPMQSPGQSVNVLYVPSSNELTTSVVVWVDETGGK